MLRNYSQTRLDFFRSAVKGNRSAFRALMTTEKCPELAAFSNAIKGDTGAEVWLKARCGADWAIWVRALDYDENAFQYLQNKEDKFAVSFVLACQNRIEGRYWLTQNHYENFLSVCEAIAGTLETRDKEMVFWYRIFN